MNGPWRGSKGVSCGLPGRSNTPTSQVASMAKSILQQVADPLQTVESTRDSLASVGYLAGESTALVSYLAGKLGKPVLVEGPAGGRKTDVAKTRSRATERKLSRL